MTEPPRHRLPDIRASVTHRIEHAGDLDIYVTVGFFEARPHKQEVPNPTFTPHKENIEQPGEVFITIGKEGSTIAGLLNMIAIQMSLMLQYSIPWARIARKLRHTHFEPYNAEGHSVAHAIVSAVDKILSDRGSLPDQGCR